MGDLCGKKESKAIVSSDLRGLAAEIDILESLAMAASSIAGKPELSRNPIEYAYDAADPAYPMNRWQAA